MQGLNACLVLRAEEIQGCLGQGGSMAEEGQVFKMASKGIFLGEYSLSF